MSDITLTKFIGAFLIGFVWFIGTAYIANHSIAYQDQVNQEGE